MKGCFVMSKQLFIACSREGLPYAEKLKLLLDRKLQNDNLDIRCEIWNEAGSSAAGNSTLDNLRKKVIDISAQKGYAVAVCTPDDELKIRDKTYRVARDNVVFEFGLFMGALGQNRVFAVLPESPLRGQKSFYFLSDLKGIQEFFYHYRGKTPPLNTLEDALNRPADDILTNIKKNESNQAEQNCVSFPPNSPPNMSSGRWPFYNP